MMRFGLLSLRPILITATVLTITACASVVDTPQQELRIVTPGAEGARCTLTNDHASFVAHPPKAVTIHRASTPLTVTCQAPGNRERTTVVYAKLNKTALGNATTAGVGAVYDQVSGALYEYPSPVTVDFTATRATQMPLPSYHNHDTVSPLDQVNEDGHEKPLETPAEQKARIKAMKPAPAPAPNNPVAAGIVRPY